MTSVIDRCVFVVGRQRSGTTVLRKTLATHADVVDLGEIMHPDRDVGFYPELAKKLAQDVHLGLHQNWMDVFIAALERLAEDHNPNKKLIVDVKYNMVLAFGTRFAQHKMSSVFLRSLAEMRAKIIHIVRRDKLSLLVSERVAIKTQQWQLKDDQERKDDKVFLAVPDLAPRIVSEESQDYFFEDELRYSQDSLRVVYEEFFDAEGNFKSDLLIALAQLMDLEPTFDLAPRLRKQGRSLEQTLENFEEVARAVRTLVDRADISPLNALGLGS